MALNKIRKNDKKANAFVQEVKSTLVSGKKHQTPGLGTFSTCARKDASGRVLCKMAMFRANQELREYAAGGSFPRVSGAHSEIVGNIVEALRGTDGIEIPHFGRLAIVPEKGKGPKIIFHAADDLNSALK